MLAESEAPELSAVVLQHRDDAPGGVLVDALAAAGFRPELEWLRQADKAGTAVLGVGLGAQALAIALGGGVQRASRARHGWVWISSSIPGWISPGPWLAWQEDVIRLPPNARLLAHDPVGPQAYMTNGHLGVQFHPEVTSKILGGWIASGHASPIDTQGILEVASREYRTASAAAQCAICQARPTVVNRSQTAARTGSTKVRAPRGGTMSFSEDPTQSASPGDDPTRGAAEPAVSGDPTQGTEVGATGAEDPTAGPQGGGNPYDDPTQGVEVGELPGEDPTD
jgi:GMP synthase-like glutamine amidotransferase